MEKSLLTFSIAIVLLLCLADARQVQAQSDKKTPPPPTPAAPAPAATVPAAPRVAPRVTLSTPPVPASAPGVSPEAVAPALASPSPAPPLTTEDVAITEVTTAPPVQVSSVLVTAAPAPQPPVKVDLPPTIADTSAPTGFKRLSTTINDDGKTKTELMEATDHDGKTYRVNRVNNTVTSLAIDGVEIPKEKYADYQSLIDRLDAAHAANQEKTRQKYQRIQEVRLKNQEINLRQQQDMQSKKWAMQQRQMDVKLRDQNNRFQQQNREYQRKEIALARGLEQKKYDLVLKKGNAAQNYKPAPCDPVKVEVTVSPVEPRRKAALFSTEKRELFSRSMPSKSIELTGPRPKKLRIDDADNTEQQKENLRRMADDLVADGIIKSPKRLEWLGLTDNELIVNGKKQPDEVQQKYRAKYITRPGLGLFYGNVHMTGKGYFIDKMDL